MHHADLLFSTHFNTISDLVLYFVLTFCISIKFLTEFYLVRRLFCELIFKQQIKIYSQFHVGFPLGNTDYNIFQEKAAK